MNSVKITDYQTEIIVAALKCYKIHLEAVVHINYTEEHTTASFNGINECDSLVDVLQGLL